MRVFQIIFSFITIILCFVSFYLISMFYDSTTDRFSFVDWNISDVSSTDDALNEEKPKIYFSNVYNMKYKYYQLCGLYFVVGFIFSLTVVCMIQTKLFKRKIIDLFQEEDDVVLFFMISIILGLLLTYAQVFIYNRVFINSNNRNNSVNTVEVIDNK